MPDSPSRIPRREKEMRGVIKFKSERYQNAQLNLDVMYAADIYDVGNVNEAYARHMHLDATAAAVGDGRKMWNWEQASGGIGWVVHTRWCPRCCHTLMVGSMCDQCGAREEVRREWRAEQMTEQDGTRVGGTRVRHSKRTQ